MTLCCDVEISHICMPEFCVHDSSGSNESFQLEDKLTFHKKFLVYVFLQEVSCICLSRDEAGSTLELSPAACEGSVFRL